MLRIVKRPSVAEKKLLSDPSLFCLQPENETALLKEGQVNRGSRYCTVTVMVPVSAVAPEVPVTVTV